MLQQVRARQKSLNGESTKFQQVTTRYINSLYKVRTF